MVALMCMELWHAFAGPLISLPKKVRRPDNGSKTLSELKFQIEDYLDVAILFQ
ncbi:hypothetical protein KY289_004592 [Solanum tuberosum]|nr:hypothetical protein KY289_004592 [Solanum tuberosum]